MEPMESLAPICPSVPEDQPKFSRCIQSPTVPVIVGHELPDPPQTFYLHSGLLSKASSYFRAALKPDQFVEGQKWKVELDDVNPDIFGFFVEWLYRDGWGNLSEIPQLHETTVPLFVRVYALGERLFCPRMQDAAADIVYRSLDEMGSSYSDTVVCDLVEITESELGSRTSDDPLGDRILWLAVGRLEKLQEFDRFTALVQEHDQLATHICMRAGSKGWHGKRKSGSRFKRETAY
ncbi:hypothetical protein AJ78_08446 [Emergomyces pasteurianus Ep9510]|uniref:BTB domain-containing protein n=1 Tax=Emergomyces pasteurianus Ep9510 TaxID=1447872 RepID=A0A1J9P3Z5_9EURO|nr:hypothetical protein AJ78_08446 [Emergomyces pasteurianus Ep9510]